MRSEPRLPGDCAHPVAAAASARVAEFVSGLDLCGEAIELCDAWLAGPHADPCQQVGVLLFLARLHDSDRRDVVCQDLLVPLQDDPVLGPVEVDRKSVV